MKRTDELLHEAAYINKDDNAIGFFATVDVTSETALRDPRATNHLCFAYGENKEVLVQLCRAYGTSGNHSPTPQNPVTNLFQEYPELVRLVISQLYGLTEDAYVALVKRAVELVK